MNPIRIQAGAVAVKYIGRRAEWHDRMYDTGLYFVTDQVREIPQNIARKLLKHVDLFEQAETLEAAPVEAADDDTQSLLEKGKQAQQEQEQDLDQIQDRFDQIDRMDKAGLTHFAQINYQQNLKQSYSLTTMREMTKSMVQQFGVV